MQKTFYQSCLAAFLFMFAVCTYGSHALQCGQINGKAHLTCLEGVFTGGEKGVKYKYSCQSPRQFYFYTLALCNHQPKANNYDVTCYITRYTQKSHQFVKACQCKLINHGKGLDCSVKKKSKNS